MVAPGPQTRLRHYGRTASMILPMWALDSISRCAAAASANGKTRWMTGFSLRAANSGQTFSRNERASATFLAAGLARKVEPVTVSRFIMMWRQSTVTLAALQERDDRHPAFQRQAFQILLDVVAADDVEDDVDAALGGERGHLDGEVLLSGS